MNTKKIKLSQLVYLLFKATNTVFKDLEKEGVKLEPADVVLALKYSFLISILARDDMSNDPVAVLRLLCKQMIEKAEENYKKIKDVINHEEGTV